MPRKSTNPPPASLQTESFYLIVFDRGTDFQFTVTGAFARMALAVEKAAFIEHKVMIVAHDGSIQGLTSFEPWSHYMRKLKI